MIQPIGSLKRGVFISVYPLSWSRPHSSPGGRGVGVRHALSPESSLTGAAMVRESDYAVWNELTDRAEEAGIGIQRGKTAGRRINRERQSD